MKLCIVDHTLVDGLKYITVIIEESEHRNELDLIFLVTIF